MSSCQLQFHPYPGPPDTTPTAHNSVVSACEKVKRRIRKGRKKKRPSRKLPFTDAPAHGKSVDALKHLLSIANRNVKRLEQILCLGGKYRKLVLVLFKRDGRHVYIQRDSNNTADETRDNDARYLFRLLARAPPHTDVTVEKDRHTRRVIKQHTLFSFLDNYPLRSLLYENSPDVDWLWEHYGHVEGVLQHFQEILQPTDEEVRVLQDTPYCEVHIIHWLSS